MAKVRLAIPMLLASMALPLSIGQSQAQDTQKTHHHQRGCTIMPITTLPKEHPLSVAGLKHIRVVKQMEVGAREGDVVFQFPHGKIIAKPHYPPRKEGIVPDVNLIKVLQESFRARTSCFGARAWDREPGVTGDWQESVMQPMPKGEGK